MGFSESDTSKCRRHPNPKQLPGVCSSCLKEQLSKLSISSSPSFNSRRTNFVSSTNSSSTTSSTIASSNRHRRNGSELSSYVSVGIVLNTGLKKSRSVSCAPLSSMSCREKINNVSMRKNINNNDQQKEKEKEKEKESKDDDIYDDQIEEECKMRNKKKGGGFLKRLMHTTSKKTKGALMHSKPTKPSTSSSCTSSSTTTSIAHN